MTPTRRALASRRDVLLVGVKWVAGGVALRLVGCARRDAPKSSAASTELLLPRTFTELESMRAVGRKFLEAHPDSTLAGLLRALDPARGFAALDAEIRQQFTDGRVVRIEGWVLARTEAVICAVVALGG